METTKFKDRFFRWCEENNLHRCEGLNLLTISLRTMIRFDDGEIVLAPKYFLFLLTGDEIFRLSPDEEVRYRDSKGKKNNLLREKLVKKFISNWKENGSFPPAAYRIYVREDPYLTNPGVRVKKGRYFGYNERSTIDLISWMVSQETSGAEKEQSHTPSSHLNVFKNAIEEIYLGYQNRNIEALRLQYQDELFELKSLLSAVTEEEPYTAFKKLKDTQSLFSQFNQNNLGSR